MDENNITFDEQARHYLGSLFDDNDANALRKDSISVRPSSRQTLSSSRHAVAAPTMPTKICAMPSMAPAGSMPIGPIQSPNTAFWPEPPPPYSPPLDPGKFGEFVNTADASSWKGVDSFSAAKSSFTSTPLTNSSVSPLTTASSGSHDATGLMSFLPPLPSFTSLTSQVEETTNKYYDECYSSLLNPFEGVTATNQEDPEEKEEDVENELEPKPSGSVWAAKAARQPQFHRSMSTTTSPTAAQQAKPEAGSMTPQPKAQDGFPGLRKHPSERSAPIVPPGGKSYRDVASNAPPSAAKIAATPLPPRSVIVPSQQVQQSNKSAVAATRSTPPHVSPKTALSSPSLVTQLQKVTKKEKRQAETASENTTPVRKQHVIGLNPVEPSSEPKRSPKKSTASAGSQSKEQPPDFQPISSRKKKGRSKTTLASSGSNTENEMLRSEEETNGVGEVFLPSVQTVDSSCRFEILNKLGGISPQKAQQMLMQRRSQSVALGTVARNVQEGADERSEEEVQAKDEAQVLLRKQSSKALITATPRLSTDSGKGIFPFARRIMGASESGNGGTGGRRRKKDRKQRDEEVFIISLLTWLFTALFTICRKAVLFVVNLVIDFVVLSIVAMVVAARKIFKGFCDATRWTVEKIYDVTGWFSREVFGALREAIRSRMSEDPQSAFLGLEDFIPLPTCCEEILERLYFADKLDAYAVLGVRSDSAMDDIRCYHKRQLALLKGDKAGNAGVSEAISLISAAFSMVNTTDLWHEYAEDFTEGKANNLELQNIIRELRRKINRAQNFLQCECGVSHAITRVPDCKPISARYCRKCAAKHQARNHDIWAETRFFGLFWNYYACLNGVVYDITQWADCSANKLKHMKANSHMVQYRLHNICTTTEYIGSESPAHQRNGSKKQRSGSERQCCAGCGSIRQPSTATSSGETVSSDPFSSAFADDNTSMTGPFISVSTNAVAAGGDAESNAKKAGRRRRVR